jgi:excisionase family DNA binding protein
MVNHCHPLPVKHESFSGELMTTRQVGEMLRMSSWTVYKLIKSGEINAVKVGRNWKVRRAELINRIETRAFAFTHDLRKR